MSGAPTILRKRNAMMGGDPVESDRLRGPFLAMIGRRANTTVLRELGIPIGHGTAWISGVTVLADRYQVIVRTKLAQTGALPSPCA